MCAAPTAPTLTSITNEALKKAGYKSGTTQFTDKSSRAQNEWMEEIKNDIALVQKKFKLLMVTTCQVTTGGLAKYSMPSDFGRDYTLTLLDGANTGTFQAGSTTSTWVFDTNEDETATSFPGKEVLVYSGTGINMLAQVTSYNATTKQGSVTYMTDATAVAPIAGDSYFIVDTYYNLEPMVAKNFDELGAQASQGTPIQYYPIGDEDNGEFILYQTPYRSSGVPWGLRQRYFADLTRLDLASTAMTTVYRQWRSLFVQGVYAKALQDMDDGRAEKEYQTYMSMLQIVATNEKYGAEVDDTVKMRPRFRK